MKSSDKKILITMVEAFSWSMVIIHRKMTEEIARWPKIVSAIELEDVAAVMVLEIEASS